MNESMKYFKNGSSAVINNFLETSAFDCFYFNALIFFDKIFFRIKMNVAIRQKRENKTDTN